MASNLQLLFIIFLLTLKHTLTQPTQLNLKLTKDPKTLQYTTQLLIGTPQLPVNLLIHLSGQSIWLNCPQPSHSQTLITKRSIKCLMAKNKKINHKHSNTCSVSQLNPITGVTSFGDLVEDVVKFDGLGHMFLFSCSPEFLVNGLVNGGVNGAKGVLGLGRSKIGLQAQMVNNFGFERKFLVCLSSSEGFLSSGAGAGAGGYRSLTYTPLVVMAHDVDGYYVNVNSVKVNGRRLVNGGKAIGAVEVSSTVPYTVMEGELYGVFERAFVSAAKAMNMSAVGAVGPFGVCFSASAGPNVAPEVELVFQSELVKWRIQGGDLMVDVGGGVRCLGVVDGGLGMIGGGGGSMILGAYQLEDHLLEFDLGRGMMGFSSSLLLEGSSCSKIGALVSTPRGSL